MTSSAPTAPVGALLRQWRGIRRLSQLALALRAGTSSRHLSFVETGKARPSPRLLERLSEVLDIPLRERNALLLAAGYAPAWRSSGLESRELETVRNAVDFFLQNQEPFPAFVLNRHWDVVAANAATDRIHHLFRSGAPKHRNLLRRIFDPEDMRPLLANWEEVAGDALRHLHADLAAFPTDTTARALLEELMAYPGVPAHWGIRDPAAPPPPILTAVFRQGDLTLRFFSAFISFGAARDVTVEELRIECMFPGDDVTAQTCRELARAATDERPHSS